jgi:putative adenylate-forming enzyme
VAAALAVPRLNPCQKEVRLDSLSMLKMMWRLRELRKNDRRPRLDTLALCDARFRRLADFARSSSPFYAEFHKGLAGASLSDLPVLTKATMMERFDDFMTDRRIRLADVERHLERLPMAPLYLDRYRVCSTSGSTGHRGFFLFDQEEWLTTLSSFRRSISWCRLAVPFLLRQVAVIVSTVPWHLSAQAGMALRLPGVRLARFDAADPLETLTKGLNDLQPQSVLTYPSVGRALAKEQLEGRLAIAPRVVFTGSEVLTPAVRSLLERAWGRGRVFDHYGATETGSIAAECDRHRLHLTEDLLMVEGVDRQNRPVPAGVVTEKLLVTVLFRRTQPLIRYELSDRIVFSPNGCDCGLPWRVLERVEGRDEEVLRLPAAAGGTREVHPMVFEGILDILPVAGWQVTSDGNDLTVLLAGADGIDPETVREKIQADLIKRGVAQVPVNVRRVLQLTRTATGKAAHVRMATGPVKKSDQDAAGRGP